MNTWSILTLGLNPALQRILQFDNFVVGQVNRASEVQTTFGGKGQHAAKACNFLKPGSCACAQFLGGDTGAAIASLMEKMHIPQLTVDVQTPTRICTTILAGNDTTELVDPSSSIPSEAVEQLRNCVLASLPHKAGIALCGTYPPGVDEMFYADVIRSKDSAFVLLDAYRGIDAALETKQVDMLKINVEELRSLTGINEIESAAAHCLKKYSVKWVALTNGPDRASLHGPTTSYQYDLPGINAINPIGAGDTCTGVSLLKITEGLDAPDAFRWGLAAASASCLHMEGATFGKDNMEQIYDQIRVTEARNQ